MSEASIAARAAMKAKAKRLVQHNNGKVDATSGDLPKAFDATPKTGQRPVTKAYASGGKVHGKEAHKRADRMPRKKREDGGKTDAAEDNATTSAEYRKRLEAAQSGKSDEASERKRGGRTGKMGGGSIDDMVPAARLNFAAGRNSPLRAAGGKAEKHSDEAEDKKLIRSMVKKEDLKRRASGGRNESGEPTMEEIYGSKADWRKVGDNVYGPRPKPTPKPAPVPSSEESTEKRYGGRTARKHGGRTGKTAVNIVIATGHKPDAMGGPGAPQMMGHPIPPQMQPPSMPPGAGPAMQPPQGPPGMPPGLPMGRKRGGRTSYPIDTGSGGGLARLDKIKAYGATQK